MRLEQSCQPPLSRRGRVQVRRLVRPRGFLALCCVLLAGWPAAAADLTVVQTVFLPSVFYVGDQVELRITLRTAFADSLVVPSTLPKTSWGQIDSIVLIRDLEDPELRIRFTPFVPGTRTLPPIELGPVVLEGVNVYVSSILQEGMTELYPPREPMLLPGTGVLLVLQILVLLLIPLGGFFLLRRGRPVLRRLWVRYREGLPYRRTIRNLKSLSGTMEFMDARSFYIRVLEETRLYLSDRLRIPALSATTSELESFLVRHIHAPEAVQTIMELFRHGDRVKFARETSSLSARMQELEGLEVCLHHVEQEERLRRRALESKAPEGAGYVDL